MSSIVIAGDTSGSVTLAAPAVSGSSVLSLPAVTDTVAGIAATQTLTNKSIAATQLTGTIAAARLPASSLLQLVTADYSTSNTTSSTTYIIASQGSITTTSNSSKIQIIASFAWNAAVANSAIKIEKTISAVTTTIYTSPSWVVRNNNASLIDIVVPINYYDSPAQNSGTAITYTISVNRVNGSGTIITNESYTSRMQLLEISA